MSILKFFRPVSYFLLSEVQKWSFRPSELCATGADKKSTGRNGNSTGRNDKSTGRIDKSTAGMRWIPVQIK